ncbi:MAG TPA: YheE family protein [Bacillaceae bacterium]
MLQHFQYQSLYEDKRLPGWKFSFYHNGSRFEGLYHASGKIEWSSQAPEGAVEPVLQKQIHDLMLYHVYDQQR